MTTDTASIALRLFGALRSTVGEKEVNLPCAGGTVKEALCRFAEERGDKVFRFIFDEQGNQQRSLIVLVNDTPITDSENTRIKAGDVISLLLPLAGG